MAKKDNAWNYVKRLPKDARESVFQEYFDTPVDRLVELLMKAESSKWVRKWYKEYKKDMAD